MADCSVFGAVQNIFHFIMPRKYKTREGARKRVPLDKEHLETAVQKVLEGQSIRGTAKAYGIAVMTLKRYVRKTRNATEDEQIEYAPNYRHSQVFTNMEENELVEYLAMASKLYHGLTPKTVRQLAYQYAYSNQKNYPPKWAEHESATYDWFYGFMSRHRELSLRVPEATSLSRATAFNKHNVGQFFENLKSLYDRYNFRPDQIWNIDETGITTVHKPKKIVACRGLKQVSKVTSGERGQLVTVCAAINAMGNHLPPFMIFPRKNWQQRMIDGAPPGTEGAPHPSGWMTGPNFLLYLKFFLKYVRCSKDSPCLIILYYNHESHLTVESINFSKENGIHLLTIPPHTSQKLQPLDRILFGTMKSYYNTACDNWMVNHPGRPLTIYDLAGCLGSAYPNAMTARNIQKSFSITGISPFNPDIFTDDEFLSSYVTDRPVGDNQGIEIISSALIVEPSTQDENEIIPRDDSPSLLSGPSSDAAVLVLPTYNEEFVFATESLPTVNVDAVMSATTIPAANNEKPISTAEARPATNSVTASNTTSAKAPLTNDDVTPDISDGEMYNDATVSQPVNNIASCFNLANVNAARANFECSPDNRPTSSATLQTPSLKKPLKALLMPVPSTSGFVSPEVIRPHPKAGPRKGSGKGRKRGSTKILTDTPEKLAIENEWAARQQKKQKKICKIKAKKVKRNLNSQDAELTTSEDEQVPPSPESDLSPFSESEVSSSESENTDVTNITIVNCFDWVIVNLVSEKNLVHRFVGQVIKESQAGYDIKFAKKINEKCFKWPIKDDIGAVAKYQIVKKLPNPKQKSSSKRVISIEFPKSLGKFNIK